MRTLGVIGGTGLDHWGQAQEKLELPGPYGDPSGPVSVFHVGDVRLLFLPRHGPQHHLPPHCINYRANHWALKEAGADTILAVNAVGGITEACGPGVLVIPDQIIDYTYGREHTLSDSGNVTLLHTEFAEPFAGPLRDRLLTSAAETEGVVMGGCIGVCQGPRFETAAEIRRMRRDGCDVVGMTSMPEAILAREMQMDYAAIHAVANWGAGISDEPISEDKIDQTLEGAMQGLRGIVGSLVRDY